MAQNFFAQTVRPEFFAEYVHRLGQSIAKCYEQTFRRRLHCDRFIFGLFKEADDRSAFLQFSSSLAGDEKRNAMARIRIFERLAIGIIDSIEQRGVVIVRGIAAKMEI